MRDQIDIIVQCRNPRLNFRLPDRAPPYLGLCPPPGEAGSTLCAKPHFGQSWLFGSAGHRMAATKVRAGDPRQIGASVGRVLNVRGTRVQGKSFAQHLLEIEQEAARAASRCASQSALHS